MNRDPETIQREIEHAREELGSTLDQLVERTSPKRLAEVGKASVREFVTSTKGKMIIGGTAAAVTAVVVINRLRNRRAG
ncbi:MAG: DUF3618 domain-containing protein [Geodermatophilaceae bacterium]|nr:DUF3618 domain-containing protein [Geodermatophilaceae bacterium]